MILAKLIKPCKICIYEQAVDGGEVESFSLLKLSLKEFCDLMGKVAGKEGAVEATLDGSIVLKYSGNDDLHQEWKKLALEHLKASPKDFIDVSKKYKSTTPGTSCLIRDAIKHVIRIALRKGDDNCTINRLCVDNAIRERFFQDAKMSTLFKESKKYAIDSRDLKVYSYWSKYMNTCYISNVKQVKQPKDD